MNKQSQTQLFNFLTYGICVPMVVAFAAMTTSNPGLFSLGTKFMVGLMLTYFICSVPFGLILTKFFLNQDVREIGSGSTGATNVLRTGNRTLAAATMALDAIKPLFSYGLSMVLFPELADLESFKLLLAPTAFIGHCYPIYLHFKGGKGIATAWGTMFMFNAVFAWLEIAIWAAIIRIGGKSSLGALITAVLTPFIAYAFIGMAGALMYTFIVALVFVRHSSNIKRMISGTEDNVKLTRKKK